jgi:cell division protein FtsW
MLIAGLVMQFSASAPTGNTKFGNSYHFIIRQLGYACVGLVLMFSIASLDYRKLKKYSIPCMFGCMFLLFLVLTPLGTELNGSQRWLFGIQPSEFTKFAMAAYCAYMIELGTFDVTKISKLVPYLMVIGIVAALMMCETHLSGCIIIVSIAAVVLLVGGASIKLFLSCGGIIGVLGFFFIKSFLPNRWARILSFCNPFADTSDKGYQVIQGLYAIGSGGLFGRGLGQSVQKSTYLPEPYNDFIFTIVCEELGFIGALAIIVLFGAIIFHGLKIAFRAQDKFGMLTVIGIMAQIGIQTAFNIAVATSSIPCTGISLPFFSYGGTAIVVLLAEMGFVLSVSRFGVQPNLEKTNGKV